MPYPTTLNEFRSAWLPHTTDAGLNRLVELLERASPFLIHGTFERCAPTGCLATHIAWHHPATQGKAEEPGVHWLTRIAGLNPATSSVIQEWDKAGVHDWNLRHALLDLCKDEQGRRLAKYEPSNC